MTDVQAADPASPLAARPWLAMLLALLVAMLPGPRMIAAPGGQDQHLSTAGYALAAIAGRDVVARKEVATQSEVPPVLASSASLALPLRTWAPISYDYQPWVATFSCALLPCARAPPVFRMTA